MSFASLRLTNSLSPLRRVFPRFERLCPKHARCGYASSILSPVASPAIPNEKKTRADLAATISASTGATPCLASSASSLCPSRMSPPAFHSSITLTSGRWLLFAYGDRLRNISPMALHDDQLAEMRRAKVEATRTKEKTSGVSDASGSRADTSSTIQA